MNKADDSKKIEKIVQDAAHGVGEWVDSIQIIVTWRHGENSKSYCFGEGCIYARMGAAQDWLMRLEEDEREYARLSARARFDEEKSS